MQSIIIIHYPLYDTAMIICEVVQKRSGGPLYDTAVIICKGVCERTIEGPGSVCVWGGGDPEMWKYLDR